MHPRAPCGISGYLTHAVLGVPNASERGTKSELAHKYAPWQHNPCRLRATKCFRAGDKITTGPQVELLATQPLPTSDASHHGTKSEAAHKWAKWLHNPCRPRVPQHFTAGTKSQVAHKWVEWIHNPCRLGNPKRVRAGPLGGLGGYITPTAWGVPDASQWRTKSEWATRGQSGYINATVRGSPKLQSGGTKSEVAQNAGEWLHSPCRRGVLTASQRETKS